MISNFLSLLKGSQQFFSQRNAPELRKLLIMTAFFFSCMLLFCLNRYYTLFTAYDHGLFNQLFWNNLHGHFFQSSLSSGNSVGFLQDHKVLSVSFCHFGQHFVPDFLLWLPIYAVFPSAVTLVLLQVGLMTAAGLVLYALARHYLRPELALLITAGYYGASAVIGPTFGEFYEQCQIPLLVFSLLLAMEKQRWWLFWILAVLVLGIREDAGFMLFSIGLYLLLSRRYVRIGLVLCLLSFSYVTVVTNVIMSSFSDDSSRLYLSTHFSHFVKGNPRPSTIQILWGMMIHPDVLLGVLFHPSGKRALYLFKQWLPIAFVPVSSSTVWVLSGVPLLSLFLQFSPSAFDISARYAIAVVPGLFYGTILWWSAHPNFFKPLFRYFWVGCIGLSVLLATYENPNNAFYFLSSHSFRIPVSLIRQWQHSEQVGQIIAQIPPDASISATDYLIPHLSSRRSLIRLPAFKLQNDEGQIIKVDYLIADLWRLEHDKRKGQGSYARLEKAVLFLDRAIAQSTYGVLEVRDSAVLLQKATPSKTEALAAWSKLRHELPRVEKLRWTERI